MLSHILERIARTRTDPHRGRRRCDGVVERYAWPGNVRELQNPANACRSWPAIGHQHRLIESDPVLRRTLIPAHEAGKAGLTLKSGEKEQLLRAIKAAGGIRRNAAGLLGISRATLYRKLRQHGL
jgi:transcriptional regulator of acetoin/glycerol metabolism